MDSLKMFQECKSCKTNFSFTSDECWWDEKGFGYSTKLVKCSKCGRINVVKHEVDYSMDVNNDERFYDYRRKSIK